MQQAVYLCLIEGNHGRSGGAVQHYNAAAHIQRHNMERLQFVF
jgi:hypothetical protein